MLTEGEYIKEIEKTTWKNTKQRVEDIVVALTAGKRPVTPERRSCSRPRRGSSSSKRPVQLPLESKAIRFETGEDVFRGSRSTVTMSRADAIDLINVLNKSHETVSVACEITSAAARAMQNDTQVVVAASTQVFELLR